jgi:hypothetical protein
VAVKPAITALANIGLLVLASWPTNRFFLPKKVPMAKPTFIAVSGLNSLLTIPRIPFVPKSLLAIITFSLFVFNR